MACNQRYPTNIEKSSTQKNKTNMIFYNSINEIVLAFNVLLVIIINCRHLWDVFPLISVTYVTFYTKLQILTLLIAYINEPYSPTPGRKKTLVTIFWSGTNLGVLEIQVLLIFLWPVVCKWPVTLLALKIATQNTRLIGYFPIVLKEKYLRFTCLI